MNPIALYREFSSTWERLRSDIIAHLVLAGILYLAGYRAPSAEALTGHLQGIVSAQWASVLGEVGLPLTLAAVSALFLVIYSSLLRAVGRRVGETVNGVLGMPPFRLLDERMRYDLETVAASLPPTALNAERLEEATFDVMDDLRHDRPERVSAWLDDIGRRHADQWTLFQDACFFPVAWIGLPLVGLPPSFWSEGQGAPLLAFFLMCVFVVVMHNLVGFASARFERQHLVIAAHALRTGERREEIEARLEADHEAIEAAVEALLKRRRSVRRQRPSLRRYLQHHWPWFKRLSLVLRGKRLGMRRAWHGFATKADDFEDQFDHRAGYDDPDWLLHYLRWRLVRILRRLLHTFGWIWERMKLY